MDKDKEAEALVKSLNNGFRSIPTIIFVDGSILVEPSTTKLEQHAIDLIFLDIEMPLVNGITFLKTLNHPPKVIFTTAYAEYALEGYELKRIMRTGTVASTDDRNWELRPQRTPMRRFSQSRAIALDMESATIAANGFRFRVPYGTLLCVSDKPLHGEIKLPGMANQFYHDRVDQHLRIGMRAIELLRQKRPDQLHSRKLRSFAEVALQ